jgi:hypothetical protein
MCYRSFERLLASRSESRKTNLFGNKKETETPNFTAWERSPPYTTLSESSDRIRAIMADRTIAIEYFRNYLPPFVTGQLDFSTLTQLPDVYVSAELQKTMSDIVYSCQRKDGKGQINVSLLIEHKSYPDKFSPVQIGGYIFSRLQKQIAAGEKQLSMIVPILLYHGNGKW